MVANFGNRLLERKNDLVIWIFFGLITLIFFGIHANFTQDDAYITFRYARNIASGLGFVYNPGEFVLGTTTPLYTLVLASLNYLTKLEIVNLSIILSWISFWIASGALYQLGRSQSGGSAFAVSLIFVTNPLMRFFVGMESFLLLGFLLLSIWAYRSGRLILTALLCGFAVLVRYEMIIVVAILYIHSIVEGRKIPFRILPGFIPILLWSIFAYSTFGSPIPLSASAKLLAPRVPFLVGLAIYWYSFVISLNFSLTVIVFFFIGLFAMLLRHKLHLEYMPVLLFSLLYLIIASFLAGSFPWYYAPLLPAIAIVVACGIDYLVNILNNVNLNLKLGNRKNLSDILFSIVAVIVIGAQLYFWYESYQLYSHNVFDNRHDPYRQVSDWLIQNASPSETLATLEIGFIGYFTDIKIIDLAGLVTPELLPWADDGAEELLKHSLRLFSPDYVLIPTNNSTQVDLMRRNSNYKLERKFANKYLLFGYIIKF